MTVDAAAICEDLCRKFQREINRLLDTDRNTRKRGLLKLYEEIPWSIASVKIPSSSASSGDDSNTKNQKAINERAGLQLFLESQFIDNQLLCEIIVNDPIEKCRETALKIFVKSIELYGTTIYSYAGADSKKLEIVTSTVQKLCSRITHTADGAAFPESAEELRHQIVQLLLTIVRGNETVPAEVLYSTLPQSVATAIVTALAKSLLDPFPEVKRSGADLLCLMAIISPQTIRLHFKSLLKGLCANATHQHSKTRSITLKAIGLCLACVVDDYEAIMKDPFVPLLNRFMNDRIASTRRELSDLCTHVLMARTRVRSRSFVKEDLQLVTMLIMLSADEVEAVAEQAKNNLKEIDAVWKVTAASAAIGGLSSSYSDMDVEDGEVALHALNAAATASAVFATEASVTSVDDVTVAVDSSTAEPFGDSADLLGFYLGPLTDIILEGVENWTVDARRIYLRGLDKFLNEVKSRITPMLPLLLAYLGQPIRDDEAVIRLAAEKACTSLGAYLPYQDLLDLLLPKISGAISGADTFSHRTSSIRLLTHVLQGFALQSELQDNDRVMTAEKIAETLSMPSLFEYREAALREAVLLNVRSLVETFPVVCKRSSVAGKLTQALIYLQARLPTDEENFIPSVAKKELSRLAALNDLSVEASASSATVLSDVQQLIARQSTIRTSAADSDDDSGNGGIAAASFYSIEKLLGAYFSVILEAIAPSSSPVPAWSSADVPKATFEALVRESPRQAWRNHRRVIQIIIDNIQPKSGPATDSYEANMASYAAIRGEDPIPNVAEVDVRLALLALLEGMLRAGSKDWECSVFMSEDADLIIKKGLLPNLVWKVGRVEATIRKVCLAACYAMLKAGSIKAETLYVTAPEMVPMLVSHLDDMDVSPRHLAALCLSIVFERLRGAFGEQAIYEMYPKILKRLDDSHDDVRLTICTTLIMFLRCAPKTCYSSTTVEYMLDQYFIHLDDTDPDIQEAVFRVIVELLNISPETVMKKAQASLATSRSSVLVERVIAAAQEHSAS